MRKSEEWFDEMGRRYAQIDPRPDDPAEREKWSRRLHKWAQGTDPEGCHAAFSALCEEAVAAGLAVRAGVNAEGQPKYRRARPHETGEN